MENKFSNKSCLVTGGAGFIGSHIVERLVNMGLSSVISVDDYSSGKESNLCHLNDEPGLSVINADVSRKDQMRDVFSKNEIGTIFHNAASKKNICLDNPRRDLEVNAGGTLNLLELSVEFGVEKFVHASTGSVYGEAVYMPQDENHPLNPCSYYGVSKLAGERYCQVFNKIHKLDTTILRYFHVYGPRQESADDLGGVISIFIRRALKGLPLIVYGSGNQQRSFTYVDDLVDANIFVARNKKAFGSVYNCASGVCVTINELINHIENMVGKKLDVEYKDWLIGDIIKFDINVEKLKELGHQFNTNFKDGLSRTFYHHVNNQ